MECNVISAKKTTTRRLFCKLFPRGGIWWLIMEVFPSISKWLRDFVQPFTRVTPTSLFASSSTSSLPVVSASSCIPSSDFPGSCSGLPSYHRGDDWECVPIDPLFLVLVPLFLCCFSGGCQCVVRPQLLSPHKAPEGMKPQRHHTQNKTRVNNQSDLLGQAHVARKALGKRRSAVCTGTAARSPRLNTSS